MYGQDDINTLARDYCSQFVTENTCAEIEIPLDILLPTNLSGTVPLCRWINIDYIDRCNYSNNDEDAVPTPSDPTDTSDSLDCASRTRPENAPTQQCVPDYCYLYELNETNCRASALCDWVVNNDTLFTGGRCMNKCFNKVDVMVVLDGSQSRFGEVALNLEQTALFFEELPLDEVDPSLWFIREYFVLYTGPGDIAFTIESPGTQVVPFTFTENEYGTPSERAEEVRRYKDINVFFPQGTNPLRFNIYNTSQRFREETLGDYERFYLLISDGIGNLLFSAPEPASAELTSATCDLRDPFLQPLDLQVIGLVPDTNGVLSENVNCLTVDGNVTTPINSGPKDFLVFSGETVFDIFRQRVRILDQSVCYGDGGESTTTTDTPSYSPTENLSESTITDSPTDNPTNSPINSPTNNPTESSVTTGSPSKRSTTTGKPSESQSSSTRSSSTRSSSSSSTRSSSSSSTSSSSISTRSSSSNSKNMGQASESRSKSSS